MLCFLFTSWLWNAYYNENIPADFAELRALYEPNSNLIVDNHDNSNNISSSLPATSTEEVLYYSGGDEEDADDFEDEIVGRNVYSIEQEQQDSDMLLDIAYVQFISTEDECDCNTVFRRLDQLHDGSIIIAFDADNNNTEEDAVVDDE